MLRKPFFLLCLLFFVAVDRSAAQGSLPVSTWSARSNSGLSLLGTWTVVPDTARGIATGTWTLVDAQGNTVTGGAWSASKSPAGWDGAWRAVIAGTGRPCWHIEPQHRSQTQRFVCRNVRESTADVLQRNPAVQCVLRHLDDPRVPVRYFEH